MNPIAHLFPPNRADLIRAGRRERIRFILEPQAWASLATDAARADPTPLLGLWGDATGHVHALFHDGRARPLIASVAVEAGRYHALSVRTPAAIPFERLIRDLWGFEAMHARDSRAIIDYGAWGATAPLAARPGPPPRSPEPPEWRAPGPDDDRGLAYVEQGPVGLPRTAGARIRVTVAGGSTRSVELQHGWGHRGLPGRVAGLTPDAAVRLASRLSADAIVAHAVAFSRAVEAASDAAIPARAGILREAACELERATAFLTTISSCAQAAGARWLASEAAILLESLRVASQAAFGHRFAADLVVPGGIVRDLSDERLDALAATSDTIASRLPALTALYEASGLARRLDGLGPVSPAQASGRAACGIVGRASGQAYDARRANAIVPVQSPSAEAGCADARMRLRLAGVGEAGARLRQLLEVLPAGPIRVGLGQTTGEGLGLAEAPEGDLWHFVRLDPNGTVAAFFPRDPRVCHVALFEAACVGLEYEDIDLVRTSFGLSVEAIDL